MRPAIPLGLDGDEHRKYRKLLDPVFAPKQVEPLGAQIRELANELIDGFVDAGQADGYRAWAEPLPSTIFLTILGLPTDQLSDFLRFKNLIMQVWHERIPNYEIAPGTELLYSGNPRAPHRLPLVW